jgi:hypothetical protein
MPRLIDMLDRAVGRSPRMVDHAVDYLQRQPGPERIISEDGTYNAGWFEDFTGDFNFGDSSAFDMAMHRWFHVTIDAPDHFIVWNLADFSRAGNTAVLVAYKKTGRFEHASITRLFNLNDIQVDPPHRHFQDPNSNSFTAVDEHEGRFRFSMHADHIHISGVAERVLGPAMVQCTRFHRGRGSLQWYGCVRLVHGTLTVGDEVIQLAPGSFGTYDRTMGHQRGLQGWNWIATVGEAIGPDGQRAQMGIQVARDIDGRAVPVVSSKKYIVWVDGQVAKVPHAEFTYESNDGRETGPWRIHSHEGDVPEGEDGMDLHFHPDFHRREQKAAGLMVADFNQYYGEVHGSVVINGQRWELLPTFAVTEDSLLEL